ncbi:uncharacterized protein A1O9_10457 [Exophiala aquamarina CBS 119918]|uniref:Major facilitator superfamily (MFS) profile domain-containing protein n=1 Tax=Exophiala aquamarina CBS 119918 TaxID=1182545 RepID=A0A072P1C9_9EURO|nr:uncharacterized protein A1O9_10457 [Exophiala aquamarina CBS 119918]KEF53482.1 hypothetical protein A1O9_10457 [Exophiala aquamarina CBS 119918]
MAFNREGQWTWKQFIICFVICLGQVAFGYPASVIGVTLAKVQFLSYMTVIDEEGNFTSQGNALIGAMSGVFQAGGCFGILAVTYIMDRWGRKAGVMFVSGIGLFSGALVCASQGVVMFLVFRFFAGIASWGALTITPVFSSELAPPAIRGFFAGMNGVSVAIGYSFATYMGLAFHDTNGSSLEWRGPLGLAVVFSLIPPASLPFVPESPRYLLMAGRVDEAKAVVKKLHDVSHADEQHFVMAEFYQMQRQTEFDKTLDASWAQMFRRPSYRQRAIVAAGFAFLSQSTGILVINNYGSILYRALGYGPLDQLKLQCGWISMGFAGNIVGSLILDKVGRRPLIILGFSGCLVALCIESALVAIYATPVPQVDPNMAGIRAAVAMLYVFQVFYGMGIDVPLWPYCAELFPNHVRAKGMAVCTTTVALPSLVYLEVASTAFANIGWKFYMVFISICSVGLIWIFYTLPETSGLPLEEIAALFGDHDDVMVFSEDIQSGGNSGELVIKQHAQNQNLGENNVETKEASTHREVVDLNT